MSALLSSLGLLILVLSAEASSNNYKLKRSHYFEGNNTSDLHEILSGVDVISIPGSPGFLSIYGPTAFPILAGKAGPSNVYHAIAVGSRADNGKLLGFAHDGFLAPEVPAEGYDVATDKNRFILNSIQWASPVANNISVFLVRDDEDDPFAEFLRNNSISVTQVSLANFTDSEQLEGHDVVCIKEFFDSDKVPFLQQHLKTGGGLIIGLTSWAHYYFLNVTGHFGLNFPPNAISGEYGFVWRSDSGDSISSPTTQDGNFNASTEYLYYTDIPSALEQVERFLRTGEVEESGSSVQRSLLQYSSVLGYGLEVIPPTWMVDLYDEALNFTQTNAQPIPSAENPVESITDKFLLEIFHAFSAYVLDSRDVPPHPASSYFPGAVYASNDVIQNNNEEVHQIRFKKPSWFKQYQKKYKDVWSFVPNSINSCNTSSNGQRALLGLSRTAPEEELVVNNKLPLWFSTGIYAPPGTPVQITIESEENLDDLQVQIGTHTDDISNLDKWSRNPRVILRNSFSNNQVTISSPYGGLVYIIIPERAVTEMEKLITVRISGAVRAPYFKLGETSIRKWREQIRYESGPWAEFATDNIVISVPSSSVRTMEDPEDLLLFWDQVMDAIADLISIPRERYRQERMVADVQISAGFMHSGYPIMTFLNEGNLAINVTELRTLGSWGHFHELGHNHQDSDWTFSGTGEVTCNLFSLYLLNTVCGIPTEKTRAEMTPERYRQTISDYIVNGLNFEEWKSNPWLALMFYVQLQKVYGWGAYKQVFAKYHELGPDDHPETDAEKIDLWLVMFSSVVQENLSVFFESWGMPVTANATASVASYPEAGFVIFDLLYD